MLPKSYKTCFGPEVIINSMSETPMQINKIKCWLVMKPQHVEFKKSERRP